MKAQSRFLASLTVLAGFFLAACTQSAKNDDSTTPGAKVDTHAQVAQEKCPEPVVGYNPFPEKVAISFGYHLRGDRIYQHGNGTLRRKVVIEHLDSDQGKITSAVRKSFVDAGFSERRQAGKIGDGNSGIEDSAANSEQTLVFTRNGLGTVYVHLKTGAGERPSNPNAQGMVSIDYPYPTRPQ